MCPGALGLATRTGVLEAAGTEGLDVVGLGGTVAAAGAGPTGVPTAVGVGPVYT